MFSGMSAWDKDSARKGQEAIRLKNEKASAELDQRLFNAVAQQEQTREHSSLNNFCSANGFAFKSVRKREWAMSRLKPTFRKPGNPQGWEGKRLDKKAISLLNLEEGLASDTESKTIAQFCKNNGISTKTIYGDAEILEKVKAHINARIGKEHDHDY